MHQLRFALGDAALHAVEGIGQVRKFAAAGRLDPLRVVTGGHARRAVGQTLHRSRGTAPR